MKAILKRKYIYIEPIPKKDIKHGLWFEIEPKGEASLPLYYTDIVKGIGKYKIPDEILREKAVIKRVFLIRGKKK